MAGNPAPKCPPKKTKPHGLVDSGMGGGPLSLIFVPHRFVLRLFPFNSELTTP